SKPVTTGGGRSESSRTSAAAFLELLAAPARARLIPADLWSGHGSGRRGATQPRRKVRQLAEGQSGATELDLGLLPQDGAPRTDLDLGLRRCCAGSGLPPLLRALLVAALLFIDIRR